MTDPNPGSQTPESLKFICGNGWEESSAEKDRYRARRLGGAVAWAGGEV